MGKRGPAPEPIPLKILKGRSPGHDIAGKPIRRAPAFERGEPVAPPWLTGPGRELWDRLTPDLSVLDLLKPGDGPALEALCSAYGDLVEATGILGREGLVAVNPQSGHVAAHPMVAVRAAARRDVRVMAREFGLTPSAESELAAPALPQDDDDPFAAPSSYGA